MGRISSFEANRIIVLWLQGLPRDKIARKLKMSGETVSRHINEFRSSLSEEAAELLDGLRQLSMELRKSGKTFTEAMNATRLCSRLNEIGVSVEEAKEFVRLSQKLSEIEGAEAQQFVRGAIKLVRLEADTGKSYKEINKEFEDKSRSVKNLTQHIEDLEKQKLTKTHDLTAETGKLETKRDAAKRKLEEQLDHNKLREMDLRFAVNLRNALTPHGYVLKDLALIPPLIGHVADSKGDVHKVVSALQNIESLTDTTSYLTQGKNRLETQLKTLRDEIDEATKQRNGLKADLSIETKKIEKKKDEFKTEFSKLQQERDDLEFENDLKRLNIEVGTCLFDTLLTQNPIDIDALDHTVSLLKMAKNNPELDLAYARANNEPQIRERLKKAFLNQYGDEFADKKDYLTIREDAEKIVRQGNLLKKRNDEVEKQNKDLADTVKELKTENAKLQKQIQLRDELDRQKADEDMKYGFPLSKRTRDTLHEPVDFGKHNQQAGDA